MKKKRANEILGAAVCSNRNAALATLLLTGLLLSGCGQKGPLTLPAATPAKATTAPAPTLAADNTLPARTDAEPR